MIAKKKNAWIKWLIASVVLIAILYFAFFNKKETPPTYLTTDVVVGDVAKSVMATGKFRAVNSINVGSQVSGQITKLAVGVGDVVQAGDLIAQIDETTQNNNVLNAQANLSQSKASLQSSEGNVATRQGDILSAEANLAVREAELQKASTHFDRLAPLLEINAISKKEYDDAKSALVVAQANVQSAQVSLDNARRALSNANLEIIGQKASIQKSQTDLATAQTNLNRTTIKAPIDGTVVAVVAEQGTTVNANQSAPTIVTLADLSRMKINAQISEADVIHIKAGMNAKFSIIGNPEQKFDAVLTGVEPAPETVSGSTGAVYYVGYLDVDNADGKFLIDMTAQVSIVIDEAKGVLTIPSSALSDEKGKTVVKILDEQGKAKTVPVEVGLNNRITAEIKSGLKVGDKIIMGESSGEKPKSTNNNRRPPMM